jgi:hypothetical protein
MQEREKVEEIFNLEMDRLKKTLRIYQNEFGVIDLLRFNDLEKIVDAKEKLKNLVIIKEKKNARWNLALKECRVI